jgi:hypothetical protein
MARKSSMLTFFIKISSPLLPVALPTLDKFGSCYLCVYSERVARAVGSNFIPYSQVQYNNNMMEFSTQSFNTKSVFGLLLSIEHR